MDAGTHTDSDVVEVVASKKRRFCPHCSQNVGLSTFYRHRDRFFDVATDEWCLQAPTHVTDSSDAFQATVEDSVSVCESEESHVHSYNETYLQGSEQENYEGVSRRTDRRL